MYTRICILAKQHVAPHPKQCCGGRHRLVCFVLLFFSGIGTLHIGTFFCNILVDKKKETVFLAHIFSKFSIIFTLSTIRSSSSSSYWKQKQKKSDASEKKHTRDELNSTQSLQSLCFFLSTSYCSKYIFKNILWVFHEREKDDRIVFSQTRGQR